MIKMFIDKIPESDLGQWLWWLTFTAIILPVIAGIVVAGVAYAAMKVNDRLSDVTNRDKKTMAFKVQRTTEQLASAQEDANNSKRRLEEVERQANAVASAQRLMQVLMVSKAPDLSKQFPLGYSLLTVSGINTVIPFVDLTGKSIIPDWSNCKVLANTDKTITLQMPDLRIESNDTKLYENFVDIPNEVNKGVIVSYVTSPEKGSRLTFSHSRLNALSFSHPDISIIIGLLQIDEDQKVIVIGIRPWVPSPTPTPDMQ